MHCPPPSNTHILANKSPDLTRDFCQTCDHVQPMTVQVDLMVPLYECSFCQGRSFGWQVGPKPQEGDGVPSHCYTAKLLFRRQVAWSRLRQQFSVLVSPLGAWRGPFRIHMLPRHKLLIHRSVPLQFCLSLSWTRGKEIILQQVS